MAGFLFIRSRRHAAIVAGLEGLLIGIPPALLVIKMVVESWNSVPPLSILIPSCFIVIAVKIGWSRSRTMASSIVLLLAAVIMATYATEGRQSPSLPLAWLLIGIASYGLAATVAYVRLSDDDPRGMGHRRIIEKMWTVFSVTVSTCCCLLLGLGIYDMLTQHAQNHTFVALAIMSLFVVAFCEPFIDWASRLTRLREVVWIDRPWLARLGIISFGIAGAILHKGLENGIDLIRISGFTVTFTLVLVLLVLPGQITGAWIVGTSTRKSAWLGFSRGGVLGLLSVTFVWIIKANLWPYEQRPNLLRYLWVTFEGSPITDSRFPANSNFIHQSFTSPSPEWKALAIINVLVWSLFGLLGGLVVKRRLLGRTLFCALFVAAGLIELTLFLADIPANDIVRLGIVLLSMTAGWVLGILMYPPARALLSRVDTAQRPVSPERAENHKDYSDDSLRLWTAGRAGARVSGRTK
jgi:hypothetical protein